MVVKKVRNPRKSSSLKVRIHRLADYIDAPETHGERGGAPAVAKAERVAGLTDYFHQQTAAADSREKCVYSGARGFITTSLAGRKAEMLSLARQSVHSKDPISHYVLSWRLGEQPTPAQIEEAVDVFLDELGLSGHQAIYGLHVDTDNVHLHVMINRAHPQTLRVIDPNKGFDLEAAHRAIARIEHAQGWRREERGRYRVQADGQLQRARHAAREPAAHDLPAARRGAHPTGAKSAEHIAREEGASLIRAARSWVELHERLAGRGMRYARKGSGALVWVGEVAVKASRAGQDCGLPAVERRLGGYQPAPAGLAVAARAPEPGRPDAPRWEEYRVERAAYYGRKQADREALRQRQDAERQTLLAAHRQQRATLLQDPRGRGTDWNARRSILAARQAAERAILRERERWERAWLSARWRARFPAYADWLRESTPPAGIAPVPRRRARIVGIEAGAEGLAPHDIRAFVAIVYGRRVDYRHRESATGAPAFVDRGGEIAIADGRDRPSVLAALQLAAQKWGAFQVEGDADYQALCVRLAAEHGLRLGNPELQGALRQARRALARPLGPAFQPGGGGWSP